MSLAKAFAEQIVQQGQQTPWQALYDAAYSASKSALIGEVLCDVVTEINSASLNATPELAAARLESRLQQPEDALSLFVNLAKSAAHLQERAPHSQAGASLQHVLEQLYSAINEFGIKPQEVLDRQTGHEFDRLVQQLGLNEQAKGASSIAKG